MTPEILISFGIILLMIVGFVTEILPLSVTAFLGCLAFYITGIIDKSAVFSGFSNDIIYMIAGTMIVGEAMFQTGAAQFIGKKIIKAVGYDERRMIFVLVLAGGLLSAVGVNIKVDFLVGVLCLEEQHLTDYGSRNAVVDGTRQNNNSVVKKAGKKVVGSLPLGCLLNYGWNHWHNGVLLIVLLFAKCREIMR